MDNGIIADPSYVIVDHPPLVYDDAVEMGGFDRVLFIHTAASSLKTYANSTTFAIVYNYSATLEEVFALVRRKFSTPVKRVGFAFHNNGNFLNKETWFSDSDLEESQTMFSPNMQFMLDFLREFSVVNVDFLGCGTLQSEKWKKYFGVLHLGTGGVIVGASENNTGNMKYGGDWVMESTMENVRDMYFNGGIENWVGVLATNAIELVTFPNSLTGNLVILGNVLFVHVVGGGLSKIHKYNLTTINNVTTITAVSTDVLATDIQSQTSLVGFGNYLCLKTGGAAVSRFNISTATFTNNWVSFPFGVTSLAIDQFYLYISCTSNNIYRVALSSAGGAVTGAWLQLLSANAGLYCYNSYLYISLNFTLFQYSDSTLVSSIPATVTNLSRFIIHNSVVYDSTTNEIKISDLGRASDQLFFTDPLNALNGLAVYNNQLFCSSYQNGKILLLGDILGAWTVTSAPSVYWQAICSDSTGQYLAAVTSSSTTYLGDVYVSNNYGQTWTKTACPQSHHTRILCNSTGRKILTGSYGGSSYISNDFGSSWVSAPAGNPPYPNGYAMNSSGNIVVQGMPNSGVWLCNLTDLSGVWVNKLAQSGNWQSCTCNSSGTFIIASAIAGTGQGVWTSSDTGTTWVRTSTTLWFVYLVCDSTGKYIFATDFNYLVTSIYISSDYGATFTKSSAPEQAGYPGGWTTLTSDSTGKYPAAIAKTGGIWISKDYGISWKKSTDTTGGNGIVGNSTGSRFAATNLKTASSGNIITLNERILYVQSQLSGVGSVVTYTSDGTVNLSSAINLSGGAGNVSPIYSKSSTQSTFTITGTVLTYTQVGTYVVNITKLGGILYPNDVSCTAIIQVNPGDQPDFTGSGSSVTYNRSNKTVNLGTAVSLSGASEILSIYSVSGGTGLIYSISGIILTYTNVGTYPVIITKPGGINYYTDKIVRTDISVNRAPLLLSISGTQIPKTYTLANKTFDLKTVLSLSGGSDLSTIYSVSGSSIEYSISGTLFTYVNAGKFPISISMSGGDNYLNDVAIGVDISINRAVMSLSVSGTPRIQTYYAANKTVDLSSAITLSGGASDVSPIYSVSGSGIYTISGTILSYDTFGRYTISISLSGGQNYNNVRIGTDISVNKAQLLTSISGTPRISVFDPLNKTVDLLSVVSLSGSVADIAPIYSVSGGSPGYTISGTTLTYTNRGRFTVAVSLSGSSNYTNNVRLRADISVNQSTLSELSISGEPMPSEYTLLNKKVDLTSVLSLSGGAPDIVPIYSVSGGTGLIFSISGTILTYKDVGIYPIIVSMSGGTNYDNNRSVKTDISINRAPLPDLTVSGTIEPKTYTLSNKKVDLKTVFSLSGGAQDISAIYSVSGSDLEYSISGSIFTYKNAGIWPIFVSMSGGTNYSNDVLLGVDISINKSSLLPLSISGTPTTKQYLLANKSFDLKTIISLSGGAQDISAIYSVSGGPDLNYSISGSIFTYTNAGLWPIRISMSGGANYDNDFEIGFDVSINRAPLSLSVSGTPTPKQYFLANKSFDLKTVVSLSGGALDISAIYSVSGSGLSYSISGSIFTYTNTGIWPIFISMSGGNNYSNDVQVGVDISINKAELLPLSISGEPRSSVYTLANKTVDLRSVLTLSGGAADVSAIYYSSTVDDSYSVSGTFLTYTDRGTYPIIVSMSGGTNYRNNVQVPTEIIINQSPLAELSISGTPLISHYTLSDKTVDLTYVLTLSGGARDISAIYTASSLTDSTYSITGTKLTYQGTGTFPIIVSMSGGWNYSNDVQVGTVIRVVPPALPALSISGIPLPSDYTLSDKTVDLLRVLTLSGGAQDISAIYSVSGSDSDYSISGTTFTYTNAGLFRIYVSMSGGLNYSNDVQVGTDISINKIEQSQISISGEPRLSTYTLANKTVDLMSVLTLSGGAPDISAIFSGFGVGLDYYSISGTMLTYENTGTFPITVLKSGGKNYWNNVLVETSIIIEEAELLPLSISGTSETSEYVLLNKKVDLRKVLSLSGGAQDISAIYTVSGDSDFTISGTILTYKNAGTYTISVSMSGGRNYSNNVEVGANVIITQSTLSPLSVSGTPEPSTYTLASKTVDLTRAIVLVGGAQDISAVYSISDESLSYSISGNILTYDHVGIFPIWVSMSGGMNYSNDVIVGTDISVNQAELLPLSISGTPIPSTYILLQKTVDLTSVLTLSGGAADISAVYSVSGGTLGGYSISGTIFTYTNAGLFRIYVSMSGGQDYSNDVRVGTDISINKAVLSPLSISSTPMPYTLLSKTVDLRSVLTLSGGADDISAIYSISGTTTSYSISGTIFTYTNAGSFPIYVSFSGGTNYSDNIKVGTDISINKVEQSQLSISSKSSATYTLLSKTVDLTSVLSLSGGADDIRHTVIYSVSGSGLDYSISGSTLTYTDAGILPIFVSISGGTNYSNDVLVWTDISINKARQSSLSISGTPTPSFFLETDKTVDLTSVLSLSGGADDIRHTVIYSVSGSNYSISGAILTYPSVGRFSINVSISGGKNYENDVQTGTDISINKATIPLSISGTPTSYVFNHLDRDVLLSSAISLSGGSPESVASYKSPYVNGYHLTYTNVGSYPIDVSVSGGINYTDTSASTTIYITKATIPLSISGTPISYAYDPLYKTVSLPVAISLSGGALDISASYSGPGVSLSEDWSLSYSDVGSYPVHVSISGAPNYTDTYATTSITIYQATVPLSVSGTLHTFDFLNRNISLSSAISLSGGAPGVSAIFSGTGVTGNVLTYSVAKSYSVLVSIPGGTNYTDTSATAIITVNKATLPLSVSLTVASHTFNPISSLKNVSLLSAISISGGAQDVSARYSGSNVSGSILTYTDVGSYPIRVSISGGANYTDTSAMTIVSVTKATQPNFVLSSYSVIYDPRSMSVDLSGKGIGGLSAATKSFSGPEVSGTTLFYPDIGDYFVTATKSYPNYFDITAAYTVKIMYPDPAANTSAAELRAAGYSIASLFIIGYSISRLLLIGFLSPELKVAVMSVSGGFSSVQLDSLAYTAAQLQTANYTIAELVSVGYTLPRLFSAGYTATKLLAAGYSSAVIKATVLATVGGFTTAQLISLAYTAIQLQAAEYTVVELRSIGYTIALLFDLGFTAAKLFEAGYTPVELKTAVTSSVGGLTVAQLTALAYTAAQLQAQNYTATELKTAGYSLSLLYAAGYTLTALAAAGYLLSEINNSVPTAGYTVTELRDIGFSASQLKPAGYFLSPLVDGGFSAQNLKDASFTPPELIAHFPAADLYNVFTSPAEQITVTKAVVADMFSPTVSIVTGLSVAAMVGYTFHRIVTDITAVVVTDPLASTVFVAADFNNGNTAIYAVIDVSGSSLVLPTHYSRITIKNKGNNLYRILDASGGIYRDNLVPGNKVTFDGLTVTIGSVIATMAVFTSYQLIAKGFTTALQLIDAGFSAVELENAGYTAAQLEVAGFTSAILLEVGYTATQLLTAGYNATRFQNAGFMAEDLETAGFTAQKLQAAGFTAQKLQAANYTATQLRLADYTVSALRKLGYTEKQLQNAGFTWIPSDSADSTWLKTTSENITFPERNHILCHAQTNTGNIVTTNEGYDTCELKFSRPDFTINYSCYIEKRYATITLYTDVSSAETYGLVFLTRNIAGNLRSLVNFELNGIVIKSSVMEDGKWCSFSVVLRENNITVLVDDSFWFLSPRTVVSSAYAYRTKFNMNHDKTEIKNIIFVYFQNATNQILYSVPTASALSSMSPFIFEFDYLEGAIRELRDISAGRNITLYVQNIKYDLGANNRIPMISTVCMNASYTTRIYLSNDTTLGTGYDVMMTDTSANIRAQLVGAKMVMQQLRYVNTDGSGQVLSDIQVFI